MVINTRDSTQVVSSMGRANIHGPTVHATRESFTKE